MKHAMSRTPGVVPNKQYATADQLAEDLVKVSGQQDLGGNKYVRTSPRGGIIFYERRNGPHSEILNVFALDAGQFTSFQVAILGNTIEAEVETIEHQIRKDLEAKHDDEERTARELSRLRGGCIHNESQRCERCSCLEVGGAQ